MAKRGRGARRGGGAKKNNSGKTAGTAATTPNTIEDNDKKADEKQKEVTDVVDLTLSQSEVEHEITNTASLSVSENKDPMTQKSLDDITILDKESSSVNIKHAYDDKDMLENTKLSIENKSTSFLKESPTKAAFDSGISKENSNSIKQDVIIQKSSSSIKTTEMGSHVEEDKDNQKEKCHDEVQIEKGSEALIAESSELKKAEDCDFLEAVEEMCEEISNDATEELEESVVTDLKEDDGDDVQYIDEEIVDDQNSKFEEISDGSIDQAEQEEVIGDSDSLDIEITGVSFAENKAETESKEKKNKQGKPGLNNEVSLEEVFFATENDTDVKVLVEDKDNEDISDASLSDHNLSFEEISDDDLDVSKKRRKSEGPRPTAKTNDRVVQKENEEVLMQTKTKKRVSPEAGKNEESSKKASLSEEKSSNENPTKQTNENEPAFFTGCASTQNTENIENVSAKLPQTSKRSSAFAKTKVKQADFSCQTSKIQVKGKLVQCSINPIKATAVDGWQMPAYSTTSLVYKKFKTKIPSSISERLFTGVTSAYLSDQDCSYSLSIGPVTLSDMDNAAFREVALKGMKKLNLTFNGDSQGILTVSLAKQPNVVQVVRDLKHIQLGNRYMVISVAYNNGQSVPPFWTGTLLLMYEQDQHHKKQSIKWDGKVRAQLNLSGIPPHISKDFVHIFFPEALSVNSGRPVSNGRSMTVGFSSTILLQEVQSCYDLLVINGSQINLKGKEELSISSIDKIEGFEEEAGVVVLQDEEEATVTPITSDMIPGFDVIAETEKDGSKDTLSDPIEVPSNDLQTEIRGTEEAMEVNTDENSELETIKQTEKSEPSEITDRNKNQEPLQKSASVLPVMPTISDRQSNISQSTVVAESSPDIQQSPTTEAEQSNFDTESNVKVMSGAISDQVLNIHPETDLSRLGGDEVGTVRAKLSNDSASQAINEDISSLVSEADDQQLSRTEEISFDKTDTVATISEESESEISKDKTADEIIIDTDEVGVVETYDACEESNVDSEPTSKLIDGIEKIDETTDFSGDKENAETSNTQAKSVIEENEINKTPPTDKIGTSPSENEASNVSIQSHTEANQVDEASEPRPTNSGEPSKSKKKGSGTVKSTNLEDVSDEDILPTHEHHSENEDVILLKEEPCKNVVAEIDLTADDKSDKVEIDSKITCHNKVDDKEEKKDDDATFMTDGLLEVNMEVVDVTEEDQQEERVIVSNIKPPGSGATWDAGKLYTWGSGVNWAVDRPWGSRAVYNNSRKQEDNRIHSSADSRGKARKTTTYCQDPSKRRQRYRPSNIPPSQQPTWSGKGTRYQYPMQQSQHVSSEYNAYNYTEHSSPKHEPENWTKQSQDGQQAYEFTDYEADRISPPPKVRREDYHSRREDIRDRSYERSYGGYQRTRYTRSRRSRSRSLSSFSSYGDRRYRQPRRVSRSPISLSPSPVSKSPTPDRGSRKRRISGSRYAAHSYRKIPVRHSRSRSPYRHGDVPRHTGRRRSRSPYQKLSAPPPKKIYVRDYSSSPHRVERRLSPGVSQRYRDKSRSPVDRYARYHHSPSPSGHKDSGMKRKIFQSRSPMKHSPSPDMSEISANDRTREWIRSIEDAVRDSSKPSSSLNPKRKSPSNVNKWTSQKMNSSKHVVATPLPADYNSAQPPATNMPSQNYYANYYNPQTMYQYQNNSYVPGTTPMYQQYQQTYSSPTMAPSMGVTYAQQPPSNNQYQERARSVIQIQTTSYPSESQQRQTYKLPDMQPPPQPPLGADLYSNSGSSNVRKNSGPGSQAKKNWSMGSNALMFQRILSTDDK